MSGILQDKLARLIMEFDGRKLRHGRYINKIPRNDPRYALLKTIPKPVPSMWNGVWKGDHSVEVRFSTPQFRKITINIGANRYPSELYPYYPIVRYETEEFPGRSGGYAYAT